MITVCIYSKAKILLWRLHPEPWKKDHKRLRLLLILEVVYVCVLKFFFCQNLAKTFAGNMRQTMA